MNFFDLILIQPIFNVLVFIYGVIPGHDFGIALILFTILIRIVMWPLVRKQLHQTKVMRSIQPEIQRIRKRTAGNKQLEAQLTMELYRERGVNPFGSIGMLLLQLPIFIALYGVVRLITENDQNIPKYTYDLLKGVPFINDLIANPHNFNETMLGVVNLSHVAIGPNGIYIPLLVIAVIAGVLQFIQSKQLLPQAKEGRKLRDMLKEQAAGKKVDQSEMSAAMSGRMVYLFPALTFFISIYLAGALVLYLATTSAVAILQQRRVLEGDVDEMEHMKLGPKQKIKAAKEAEVVPTSTPSKPGKKKRRKK
jgi:YidC/Oxa1 family membrane protein insertase